MIVWRAMRKCLVVAPQTVAFSMLLFRKGRINILAGPLATLAVGQGGW